MDLNEIGHKHVDSIFLPQDGIQVVLKHHTVKMCG
jgi:hypothetical protein